MADQRKTIGLALNISENWIGGTYYIINIIRALNTLPDQLKPQIIILSPEPNAYDYTKKETNYPYLSFIRTVFPISSLQGLINAISSRLFKIVFFKKQINTSIDVLFPASNKLRITNVKKKVYWIPDFQEHYLKDFFSDDEINKRKKDQEEIAFRKNHLVLSSHGAKNDFIKFYPQHNSKISVVPFAVTNANIHDFSHSEVLKKYGLQHSYIFIANQFWVHKNHMCVLDAINILKSEGVAPTFVFTGKNSDHRSKDHYSNILAKVKAYGIESNVKFLGFIDRTDQLMLMRHAEFIIQPSLFEGWSTVIEDAKSLNIHIIASDIDVHQEQLKDYPHLSFKRQSSNDLAEKIKMMLSVSQPQINYNYENSVRIFGQNILDVLTQDL